MQTPRRINDPANSLAVLVAVILSVLLFLGQALFIVPAGKVAVVTTLGKVSGGIATSRTESQDPVHSIGVSL